jgi:hypothetical protein
MDINEISKILNNASETLQNDLSLHHISKNIKDNELIDDYLKTKANENYYSQFSENERLYQINNDEYKKLISGFSQAYLEICDFYVGKELPRETYLDSKKDVKELFSLFILAALFEPYIEAYHKKYIQ